MKNLLPMAFVVLVFLLTPPWSFSQQQGNTRQEKSPETSRALGTKASGSSKGKTPDFAPSPDSLPTVEEAASRARLLHATFRGVLQVMHRDFFDPGNRKKIPSASLEDVFDELAESQGVKIRWLGVNAKTMNVEHEPRNDFEKKAVASLASGKSEYHEVEGKFYRHVGTIRLHNVCLKCHVPNRTSLEDRAAGLEITIPIR